MTFFPISELLSSPRNSQTPVAQVDDRCVKFSAFQESVAKIRSELLADNVKKVVLATDDALNFAVLFLAGIHSECQVIIPPNLQPETLADFRGLDVRLLDDKVVMQCDAKPVPDDATVFATLNPDEVALQFFTSGSTGVPKQIPKSLRQIENEVALYERLWGADLSGAAVLSTVSPRHIYGLLFFVCWPLSAGRQLYSPAYQNWEEMAVDLPASAVVVSSPAHLSRFSSKLSVAKTQHPIMVFSSGGPLMEISAQACSAHLGVWPREIFGSTETGGIGHRTQEHGNTIWRRFDIVDVCLDAEDCLQVRSPLLADQNWLPTQDRVELISDAEFHLLGRSGRMVKVEGKRLDLDELELRILGLDWVDEVAVLSLNSAAGEIGVVAALNETGRQLLEENGAFRFNRMIRSVLHKRFELTTLPERWRFVLKLPKNSQGKKSNSDLTRLFD